MAGGPRGRRVIGLAYRDLMAQAVGHYGDAGTIVLRQANTIKGPLGVYGAFPAGATSLLAAGGGVKGDVVQGAVFEIGGVSGSYELTDAAAAVNGRLTLNFSPTLEESATDGAAVTWSQPYAETPYPRMSGHREQSEAEEIERGIETYALAYLPGKPAPRDRGNDTLGGKKITRVIPLDAGGGVSGYRVTVAVAA